MAGQWVVSVDVEGRPWVVQVLPDTRIGPFPDMRAAEAARAELAAAAERERVQ